MRLALDTRTLHAAKTGDRTVTLGLLEGLLALDPGEAPEVYCVADQPLPVGSLTHSGRLRSVVVKRPGGYLWTPFAFPGALSRIPADVGIHQYLGPPRSPCPLVTFVHDTVWRTLPQTFPVRDRLILDAFLPGTLSRAAAVCTGSEFAAAEIATYFPQAAGKLHVIPYGLEARYRPVTDPVKLAALRERYGLPERFILSVGVLQPRKNVEGLIAAYQQLPAVLRAEVGLVIVGKQGWLMAHLPHLVNTAGPGVQFTGYAPDADLPGLYTMAEVFAYPSLYEGYGLPPLEAMACGTPVLTSNVASLPEVTRGAAFLVSPTEVAALSEGLRRLLTDEATRQTLIERGLARASSLTWEAAARRLVALADEVAQYPRPSRH